MQQNRQFIENAASAAWRRAPAHTDAIVLHDKFRERAIHGQCHCYNPASFGESIFQRVDNKFTRDQH